MIDLITTLKMKVSQDVKKFMQEYGGNHVSLYKGWKAHPEMQDDRHLVEQQLSVVLRARTNYDLARRLIGRIRQIDRDAEQKELDLMFGKTEDNTVAPLADDLGVLG